MDKIKIRFDPSVNSLTVWFCDPTEESYLSPVEDEDDLMVIKSQTGQVIGFEKHFFGVEPGQLDVHLEMLKMMSADEMMGYTLAAKSE